MVMWNINPITLLSVRNTMSLNTFERCCWFEHSYSYLNPHSGSIVLCSHHTDPFALSGEIQELQACRPEANVYQHGRKRPNYYYFNKELFTSGWHLHMNETPLCFRMDDHYISWLQIVNAILTLESRSAFLKLFWSVMPDYSVLHQLIFPNTMQFTQ